MSYFASRCFFIKYFLTPRLPMLDQLADGLKAFGILDLVKRHRNAMKCIFTPNFTSSVTEELLFHLLSPSYSDNTQQKDEEINTFKAMCDFVQELQYKGKPKQYHINKNNCSL